MTSDGDWILLCPVHVRTVALSIAFAAWVLVVALSIDLSQWSKLHWTVVSIALVALGRVTHLADYSVLVAALAALKVTNSHSYFFSDGSRLIPCLAAATCWSWVVVGNSYMPALDVVVVFSWFTMWTFKLSPVPRHSWLSDLEVLLLTNASCYLYLVLLINFEWVLLYYDYTQCIIVIMFVKGHTQGIPPTVTRHRHMTCSYYNNIW